MRRVFPVIGLLVILFAAWFFFLRGDEGTENLAKAPLETGKAAKDPEEVEQARRATAGALYLVAEVSSDGQVQTRVERGSDYLAIYNQGKLTILGIGPRQWQANNQGCLLAVETPTRAPDYSEAVFPKSSNTLTYTIKDSTHLQWKSPTATSNIVLDKQQRAISADISGQGNSKQTLVLSYPKQLRQEKAPSGEC